MNDHGEFDKPLLWYYSPMDSAWSLGHFENRGDGLRLHGRIVAVHRRAQVAGGKRSRLMDIRRRGLHRRLRTGGEEKRKQHDNVHTFGCGVDYSHFSKAADPDTAIPPDIDFMNRPILGWFGVVDERVDYAMVGEMARLRPAWSFAMVGPGRESRSESTAAFAESVLARRAGLSAASQLLPGI